jgi:hypothetical protein
VLADPFVPGVSGLTYVTWSPRVLWPCVRNHATTMSVAQERILAATSMADIQRVNKQCREPGERVRVVHVLARSLLNCSCSCRFRGLVFVVSV